VTQTGLGASGTPKPKRRNVTPFNDTGFVPWSELSKTEKAARATQQSYNFGMIIVGLVLTVRTPIFFLIVVNMEIWGLMTCWRTGKRWIFPLDRCIFS
jgi:hypothetical protein